MQAWALQAGAGASIDEAVPVDFTIGDLIRKARQRRHLNQEQLGERAAKFPLGERVKAIDPNTVSRAERNPYNADFATIWRLLAALGISLSEAEGAVPNPFVVESREEERKQKWRSSIALGERKRPTPSGRA